MKCHYLIEETQNETPSYSPARETKHIHSLVTKTFFFLFSVDDDQFIWYGEGFQRHCLLRIEIYNSPKQNYRKDKVYV